MAKVTINDVAREAGVSVGTVYRAVNNTGRISEDTRLRVLDAVKKLGYKANSVARGLAMHGKFTILCILPNSPSFFWDDVNKGCMRASEKLSEFGVEVINYRYGNDAQIGKAAIDDTEVFDLLQDRKIDAIAVCAVNLLDGAFRITRYAEQRGIPVAIINEDIEGCRPLFFYGPDNNFAGRMAAELMYKFTGGKGDYLVLGTRKNHTDRMREDSFNEFIKSTASGINSHFLLIDDMANTPQIIERALKEYENTSGIYFAQFTPLRFALPTLMSNEKKYVVIGHEYDEIFKEAVKAGVITAILSQERLCQGYYPLMMLYDYLVSGESPEMANCYSNVNIILDSNIHCLGYSKHGCGYE